MASKSEQTTLLGPPTRQSPRDPPTSLAALATERLGSLKWLMAKSEETPTRTGFLPSFMRPRADVRRSASDDIERERRPPLTPGATTGVMASVTPGRGRGDRESNGGTFLWRIPGGLSRTRRAALRRGSAKNYYHLSIDLERPPAGSSVWVKSRKSRVLDARMDDTISGEELGDEADTMEAEGIPDFIAVNSRRHNGGRDESLDVGTRVSWVRIVGFGLALGSLVVIAVGATWLCSNGATASVVAFISVVIMALVGVLCPEVMANVFDSCVADEHDRAEEDGESVQEDGGVSLGRIEADLDGDPAAGEDVEKAAVSSANRGGAVGANRKVTGSDGPVRHELL